MRTGLVEDKNNKKIKTIIYEEGDKISKYTMESM